MLAKFWKITPWSLYLHNLNFIPEKYKKRNRNISIFKAPECFNANERASIKANPFSDDIFSLGMVLCYLFFEDFPDIIPRDSSEWEKQFHEITEYFQSSDHPLKAEEANFILKCVSKDPQVRYKTVLEANREIQKILLEFEEEQITIEEKLKVNWYSEPDSSFYREIIRNTPISVNEVIENPNKWLSTDFKDSQVYATGIVDNPLIIINNKDHLFGLRPIYLKKDDKLNKDIVELFVIKTRRRSAVLRAIQEKMPINILKNGLQFTSEFWGSNPLSKWRKILAIAEREIKESREDDSKEIEFIESLEIMLEAERQLDSEKILQFKKLTIKRRPEDRIEAATIVVRLDLNNDLKQKERRDVYDKICDYRNKNGGLIELSIGNTPSSSWDHGKEWKIVKIYRRNLHVVVEREIKKKNKYLNEQGVIRPFEMSASLSLYRRKERVIERIKENDLVLSALLEPQINTFYLGMDTKGLDTPLASVINTVPMFLVQGPPGTGKTWTASTLVMEILKNDPFARILISSKDHEPLDHLVEAITEKTLSDIYPEPIFVRAMSSERERKYEASDFIIKFKSMNQTINNLKNAKERLINSDILSNSLKKRWNKEIDNNISNPSLKWMDELQKIANVFFATSTSSTVEWLVKNAAPFDYVIVEEAAKSYPTELLLPMILGHRWLLIGDQNQLPPYKYNQLAEIMSELLDDEQIKKNEDDDTFYDFREVCLTNIKLFEKLFNIYSKTPVLFSKKRYVPCIQLNNQWRLPPLISDLISKIFYNTQFNPIKEAPDIGDPFISPEFMTKNQIVWIDTPLSEENKEYLEKRTPEGSIINEGEIRIIINLIQKFKISNQNKKLEDIDMVLLTPYLAQKEQIKRFILSRPIPTIKSQNLRRLCHTVDSFQGRQADIVIISLVRNNSQTNVRQALGFLTATERLNVMFSRVKKRMIIIGCSKHIEKFKNDEESNSINLVLEFIRKNCKIIPSTVLEEVK